VVSKTLRGIVLPSEKILSALKLRVVYIEVTRDEVRRTAANIGKLAASPAHERFRVASFIAGTNALQRVICVSKRRRSRLEPPFLALSSAHFAELFFV